MLEDSSSINSATLSDTALVMLLNIAIIAPLTTPNIIKTMMIPNI